MKPFQPKPKHCVICQTLFSPRSSMACVCSQRCAMKKVKADRAADRVALKARKAALQTIPQLIKVAQREFNAFIRARDSGKPCICCGLPLGEGDVGGAFDCGHYRSTGSAAHLRFDERNAHGQRKQCNRWGAGRAVDYRIGLINRIGLQLVEALEADNTPHKWERDELRRIAAEYKAKRKALEHLNASL